MDPTMQSPIRKRLSIPFSNGIEIEVPSGPHTYFNKTWVGRMTDGIGPRQAFESLSRHATPFQDVKSVDGGTVKIPMAGPVRQIVDPDRLMIVNTTVPGHVLHPGNVHRSIVQEGDDLYVVTHGYGAGVLPTANELVAPGRWESVDNNIRRELNPEIKPASHVREVVRDSAARAGVANRYNVFEFGFPESNAMLPSASRQQARDRASAVPSAVEVRSAAPAPGHGVRPVRYLSSGTAFSSSRREAPGSDVGGSSAAAAIPQPGLLPLTSRSLEARPDRFVPLPILDLLDRTTFSDSSVDDGASPRSQGTGIPMLDEHIRYLHRAYGT